MGAFLVFSKFRRSAVFCFYANETPEEGPSRKSGGPTLLRFE
jgi:hypothetical protein